MKYENNYKIHYNNFITCTESKFSSVQRER